MAALRSMLPPDPSGPARTHVYSDSEWAPHRDVIVRMYTHEGMTNEKVLSMLREDHAFLVTEKQLRGKLKRWGVQKNVPSDKMKVIAQKSQARMRQGKSTTFRFKGRVVKQYDINRFQKRASNQVTHYGEQGEANSPAPSTPSDVSCITVLGSPASGAANMNYSQSRHGMETALASMPGLIQAQNPTYYFSRSPVLDKINLGDLLVESNFEGQSPAPFTAPPTPISAPKALVAGPNTSSLPRQDTHNAWQSLDRQNYPPSDMFHAHKNIDSSTHDQSLNTVPPEIPGELVTFDRSPNHAPRKVRYRQKEEDELVQRLNDMQARLGQEHPATLDTISRLADVYSIQSRYNAMGRLCQQAAEAWQRVAGRDDPRTLRAFSKFATALVLQGKVTTSERLHRLIYAKAIKTMHPSDQNLLGIRNGLAVCFIRSSNFSDAEQLFRETIKCGGTALEPDHPEILFAMENLAHVLGNRSAYAECLKILQTLVETTEISMSNQYKRLCCMSFIGSVYVATGELHEAEKIITQTLAEQIELLGPEHEQTLYTQRRMGVCLIDQGRFAEVEALFQDQLPKIRKLLGNQHTEVLDSEACFARCLNMQHRYREAEGIGRELMVKAERKSVSESWLMCRGALEAGIACHGQGRSVEGLELLERAVEISVRIWGSEHLETQYYKSRHAMVAQHVAAMQGVLQKPVVSDNSWPMMPYNMAI